MPTIWNKDDSAKIILKIKNNVDWLRDKLQAKVETEYRLWDDAIAPERVRRLNQEYKLSPQSDKPWKIYIKLIEKQMTSFMAKITWDEIAVDFVPQWGFVAREMAEKIRKMAVYDYEAMDMFQIDAINNWYVWYRGLWVRAWEGWDMEDHKPIPRVFDPLKTIPDPANFFWSKMRFFWLIDSKSIASVKWTSSYFNIWSIQTNAKDSVSQQVDNAVNSSSNQVQSLSDYDIFECYHHYTYFEDRLFLTTWANSRKELIRIIEIIPKTKAQKLDTRKVKIPVNLKRRKFVPGRYFWPSIPDDVEMYQDQLTILANLQLKSARFQAYGPDLIVNTKYIDKQTIAKKDAWGRVLGFNMDIKDWNPQQLVTPITFPNMSQFPEQMYQKVEAEAEKTTSLWGLSNWISPNWDQTKAEILELQKNINEIFWYSVNLMLQSEKEWYEQYYEMYVAHFPEYKKKKVLFDNNWITDDIEISRSEFITEDSVIIRVKSKWQEMLRKQRKFAMYQTVAQTILPNLNPRTYSFREFLRGLLDNWGFDHNEVMRYVPYTPDETKALSWLNLLNNWEFPAKPQPWEDYIVFIEVFKMAKDSSKKDEAIQWYVDAFNGSWQKEMMTQQQWVTDPTVSAQIGNMAVSQLSKWMWANSQNTTMQ